MNKLFNFKSYFKFLGRNKTYSLINIFGFSISLMFVIIIGIYTQQEYSVDKMHTKADRIYALGFGMNNKDWGEGSTYAIEPKLLSRYPEIESTCAITQTYLRLTLPTTEKMLAMTLLTDSTFFNFFDFELVEGDRNQVLKETNSAVITEELAKKLFGNADPIGKSITCQYSDIHLIVSGICKKMENSCIGKDIDMIIRYEQTKYCNPSLLTGGNATGASVFILTKPHTNIISKANDMATYFQTFWWFYQMKDCVNKVLLLPFNSLYFSKYESCTGVTSRGDKKLVNILFAVSLVILLFSIMNYINLTVAQSGFRAKEMAIRRLLGSQRKEIITRLILESILLCFIALLIALAFSFSLAPSAGKILNTKLMMTSIFHLFDLTLLILFVLIVGTLSGIFPAIVISAAKPIEVVRGTFRRHTKMIFSKVFITFQNIITIVMIAVSITMVWQIHHLISAPLGYNTKGLISINDPESDSTKVSTFLNELHNQSCVISASACKGTPFNHGNNETMTYQGKTISFQTFEGDSAYLNILGLKLIQDNHTGNNPKNYFNKQAFAEQNISTNTPNMPFYDERIPIDGIIKDIHLGNITDAEHPIRIKIWDSIGQPWGFLIKVSGDPIEAYQQVQSIYKKVFEEDIKDEHPFLDQQIEQNFERESRISNIISLFAFVAILISLLGLIAMSTYFIQQRRREIAIRKVFGSTSSQVWKKLVKTFLTYVVIAFVIAIPIIYYFMSDWLSGYSYRISLSPIIYIAAGLFCLLISFIAVFIQSYQASNSNPVKSIQEN